MQRETELVRALLEQGALRRMPPPQARGEMSSLERAVIWGLIGLALLAIFGAVQ